MVDRHGPEWKPSWDIFHWDSHLLAGVARVICRSADDWAVQRALRTVQALCERRRDLRWSVFLDVTGGRARGSERLDPRTLTPGAARLLLSPEPECRHVPKLWIVDVLDADPPWRDSPAEAAEWVVNAARLTTDEGLRDQLEALLSATNHPRLLTAVETSFADGVRAMEYRMRHRQQVTSPYTPWHDRQPTLLTRIAVGNPHPPRSGMIPAAGSHHSCHGVLLAVLKDRHDLIREYVHRHPVSTVAALLTGIALPASAELANGCRHALRALEPGPARQEVCARALRGDAETRSAAVDAGYLPAENPAVFLFLTGQLDRYDEADPPGDLLREFCLTSACHAGEHRCEFREIAQRHGRSNPCPPRPAAPRPGPAERKRRHGPAGSWPADGGGGYDGGGHSSGFGGFSF
jgi:hypothetical protein